MGIDKSGKNKTPAGIDNFHIACVLCDLFARPDDVDLAVADQHSSIADNRRLRHLRANARSLWTCQRD
jgi:hypothetical protein